MVRGCRGNPEFEAQLVWSLLCSLVRLHVLRVKEGIKPCLGPNYGLPEVGPLPEHHGFGCLSQELYRDFVPEILTCVLSVGMSFLPRLLEVSNTRSSYTPQARNTIILIIGTHKEGHGCRTFPSIFLRDKKGHAIFLPPAIPKNDNRKYRTTQKIVVDCIH